MTTPPPPWPPQPPPWPPQQPPWPPQPPPWPPPPKPINAGLVILGMILGTVLWSGILLAMMALNNTATQFHNVPAEYLYIGESLLVGGLAIAAIAYPKTRQLGAGLLLGIAIGTVVWSGLCVIIGTGL